MRMVLTKSETDPKIYFKVVKNALVFLLLYVHDLLLTSSKPFIIQFKKKLASEFNMKDIRLMHYYLGLEVC